MSTRRSYRPIDPRGSPCEDAGRAPLPWSGQGRAGVTCTRKSSSLDPSRRSRRVRPRGALLPLPQVLNLAGRVGFDRRKEELRLGLETGIVGREIRQGLVRNYPYI